VAHFRLAVEGSDATRAAVLACLHLADQLKMNQAKTEDIRRRVAARAAELGEILDKAV